MRTTGTIGASSSPDERAALVVCSLSAPTNLRTDVITGTGWHAPNECACPSCSFAAHRGHPPVALSHLNLLPPRRTCANALAVFGCVNSWRKASGSGPEKSLPDKTYVVPAAKESRSCVSDLSASYKCTS